MGNLTFNVSVPKKHIPKKKKVVLEKNVSETTTNELYTYIGDDGQEHKFNGILNKTSEHAYGKISKNFDVQLIYHPAVEHIEGQDEYFTYIDDEDNSEHVYKGNVEYDFDKNTYIGIVTTTEVNEKLIQIFEEK